jgi:phosphoglycerol transferase MdoB-like AlkP superfamily enzyme
METLLAICLGLGLSAACGFRVFVPLLGISIAASAGHLQLAGGMEWMGSWPALVCFLTATLLEVAGYYVPWLDNALDSLATPAAIVAGTIATGAVIDDMSPLMRWTLALIAGGGIAGVIQAATVVLRGSSSVATAGLGNFLVSTAELLCSLAVSVAAFVLPLLTVVFLGLVVGAALRTIMSRRAKRVALKAGLPAA